MSVEMSAQLKERLLVLFAKIDEDSSKTITKQEAVKFWGKNFAKVNATAMFAEVDEDNNESITEEEWMDFWSHVLANDYPEEDILEELEMIEEGGSWVGFSSKGG